jgi:hypothetical protein
MDANAQIALRAIECLLWSAMPAMAADDRYAESPDPRINHSACGCAAPTESLAARVPPAFKLPHYSFC